MNENNSELKNEARQRAVDLLIDELPVLRARIGISQDELAKYIGVSRQTISAIEMRKRPVTWQVLLAMVLYFTLHPKTNTVLRLMPGFTDALKICFDYEED